MNKKFLSSRNKIWAIVVGLALLTFIGYCVFSPAEKVEWTGFRRSTEISKTVKITAVGKEETITTKEVSGKTAWDWMNLLGAPAVLAYLGFRLQRWQDKQANYQAQRERDIAEKNRKQEAQIAEENQREEALQLYFDRLSDLLIDKNLIAIAKQPPSKIRELKQTELLKAAEDVIQARTVFILRRLREDKELRSRVIEFLIDTQIVILKLDFNKLNFKEFDFKGRRVNLEGAYLSGVDLSGVDLSEVDLHSAKLKKANLQGVILKKANLWKAELEGAHLENADLEGADLEDAKLEGANLQGANLQGAILRGANLKKVNLERANLEGADLGGADLEEANFRYARLKKAIFYSESKCWHIRMGQDDYINSTVFTKADFTGADLTEANLERANFSGVNSREIEHSVGLLTRKPVLKESNKLFELDEDECYDNNDRTNENVISQERVKVGANLDNADLQGALLEGANFEGINLETVKNLTEDQWKTTLDYHLLQRSMNS